MKTLSFILMSLCAIFLPSCEIYSTDSGGYGQQGYLPPPGQVMGYAPQQRQMPPPQYYPAPAQQQMQSEEQQVVGHHQMEISGYTRYYYRMDPATGLVTWKQQINAGGKPAEVEVSSDKVPEAQRADCTRVIRAKGYKGNIIHKMIPTTSVVTPAALQQPAQVVAISGDQTLSGIPVNLPPAAPRLMDGGPPIIIRPSQPPAPGQ